MHRATLPMPSPSPLRIGVGSMVISAHLFGLMLMSLATPSAWDIPIRVSAPPIQVELRRDEPIPAIPPPPMPVAPTRPQTIQPVPEVAVVPLPVPNESALTVAMPTIPTPSVSDTVAVNDDAAPAAQVPAGLNLLFGPEPPYPVQAKRMGWQGEVLLRILVGVDGLPSEVNIVRGSGHRDLDRSARTHVLRYWRFAPLQREAYAEVPIRFALY